MAEPVYEFVSDWKSCKLGSVVCLARQAFVTEYIAFSEFDSLFGGYVLCEDSNGTSYLGVWSRRVCGRFRQTLRDQGAVLDVVYKDPHLRVRRWAYRSHTKKRPKA
jgi:hypothetical protein